MSLNSNDIFSRLLELYGTSKMNELSEMLGFKPNWGAATRKRKGIPFEACVQASDKFNVSIDYLLYGKEGHLIDINKLRDHVTEGLFAAVQTDMITLNKDVKISSLSNMITSEIIDNCNIKEDEDKKVI